VEVRFVVWATVGAFVLRLLWVLLVQRHGFPLNDTFFYHEIAVNLAGGKGFTGPTGVTTAEWPPGYPFLLSLVYRVFGHDPSGGEVLNAFLGALTVPLLYVVGRRILGRREARLVAVVLAVFPGQILWTDVLLSETLSTFLTVGVLALAVYLPMSRRSALILGLVIGLATLSRAEAFLLVVLPLAIWWPRLSRPARGWQAGILVLAAIVVVVPWTIRNAEAMHAFVPVSSNSGSTLWSGHNSTADGGATYAPQSLTARVKQFTGPKKEIELSSLLRREAINYATSHPGRELVLIPLKLVSLLRGDSQGIVLWVIPGARKPAIGHDGATRLGTITDLAWFALLTLFVLATIVYGRQLLGNAGLRAILVYIGISVLLWCTVFYGNFRYRAGLEPLMMLVAAPLVLRLWDMRTRRRSGGEKARPTRLAPSTGA
jgi:4-amino-4-deoxy-L-arabinose transferase-like glycosyltransferase